ncbi:MAG: hypothetical protein J0H82_26450 [Alphaproteobacteria bacterium]|nr:hypothetical protein [Alphaproteobacteria bacterium]
MIDRTFRPTSRGRWQILPGGQYRHEVADNADGFRHRVVCRDGRAGDWVQTGSIARLDDARAADTAFLGILPVRTIFVCERAPAARRAARGLQPGRRQDDQGDAS